MTQKPIRLAIVHPTFNTLGGAENHIIWTAQALTDSGYDITIIASGFSVKTKAIFKQMGCTLYNVWVPFVPPYDNLKRNLLIMGFRIRHLLHSFDVINVHNFPAIAWVGIACRFDASAIAPIVWTCHEPPHFIYENETRHLAWLKDVDKRCVPLAKHIVTNSAFTQQHVKAIYNRDSLAEPFGVPIPKTLNTAPKPDHTGDITIGMASRLETMKNFKQVFKAIASIKQTHPNIFKRIHIKIAGTGSTEAALKAYIHTLCIERAIQFLGFVSDAALDQLYQDALFMVFVPFEEPLGLIPIEASLHQCPTIGSNSGGPAQTIQHNVTGLLVDPHSVADIADAIVRFCKNPQEALTMGHAAQTYALAHYTNTHTAKRYQNLFESYLVSKC